VAEHIDEPQSGEQPREPERPAESGEQPREPERPAESGSTSPDEGQAPVPEEMAAEEAAVAGGEEPRIGVYICHCGGNIADVIDVEQVAEEAAKLPGVVSAKTNMFMCSDPGQQAIADDIAELGVNRVVVAACSPRLHETTFRGVLERAGINPYLYEHANIREQVSWSHGDPEQARDKATALVRAAVAKAGGLTALEPVRIPAEGAVVIVGGGVAGLRAAGDLARTGLNVTLVEKELVLGGRAAVLDKLFPYEEAAADVITRLADEVLEDTRITLHTGTEVKNVDGYVGAFTLTLRQRPEGVTLAADPDRVARDVAGLGWRYEPFRGYGPASAFDAATPGGDDAADTAASAGAVPAAGETPAGGDEPGAGEPAGDESAGTITVKAGAIVVATGYEHYVPPKGEYGYGRLPQVVTLVDFIKWLSEQPEGGTPTFNDKPVRAVAFVHCVGSRQVDGVHKPGPSGHINEYCSRVCCTATLQSVVDLKTRFPRVAAYELFQDIRAYGRGHEEYYERANKAGAVFLRWDGAQPPKVAKTKGDDFPVTVSCIDGLTWGEEVEMGVDMVVLAVGMTPADIGGLGSSLKIPTGADGFLQEVHPKLRPVELSVTGVLVAGACQAPKDVTESCASASAAAVKALGLLATGHVQLAPFVAHVEAEECLGHGHCVAECPYPGAIAMQDYPDGQQRAVVNPALCSGCGACVAVCPTKAIDLNGWSLEAYESMVDALLASGGEVAR